jgi:hypothetical protein
MRGCNENQENFKAKEASWPTKESQDSVRRSLPYGHLWDGGGGRVVALTASLHRQSTVVFSACTAAPSD